MKKILYLLVFACGSSLFAASLSLLNDSPFVLKATILAADGTILSESTLYPQHRFTWQDGYSGTPDFSQTPYTVIWECAEGSEYGVYSNLGPGALVLAQSSTGARYCKPTKKREPASARETPLNQ